MGYADLYGASDDTGPGAAAAGSAGYVAAQEATATQAPANPLTEGEHVPGLAGLVEFGHELIDTPAGLAFVLAGGLLLLLWADLA